MVITCFKITRESLNEATTPVNINDGNDVHRMITGWVDSNRKSAGLLYKVILERTAAFLYIQSNAKLPEVNYKSFGLLKIKEVVIDPAKVRNGQVISFDCKAVLGVRDIKTEKIHSLRSEEDRIKLFLSKMNTAGINIQNCIIKEKSSVRFKKGTKSVTVSSTTFVGQADITDVDRFVSMCLNGTGKCKNYGAGLFLWKPATL